MKTCPMCGTLLFDDAEKCTKCGRDLVEGGSEGVAKTEPEVGAAGTQATPESPAQPEEATSAPSAESSEDHIEISHKRKQWLEEQEKIKSELANIMGRVGKKRKPAIPPKPVASAPSQVPTPTLSSTPTVSQPSQTALNPTGPTVAPNTGVPTQAPTPQSVPQPSIPPPGQQPPTQVPPNVPGPQSAAPPKAPTTPPAQAPAPAPEAPEPGQGLTEINKKELMQELDDLRNEGYNVSKLEHIIESDPANAWKAFSDFLDDIEKLNQQKERLDKIDIEGFEDFEFEKKGIMSTLTDPELISDYESLITQFENKFLAAKSAKEIATTEAETKMKKEEEKLNKLIEDGKEKFRLKDYEEAMEIFLQASQLSPNNKEINFFKKKIEAKLVEGSAEGPVPGAEPETGMPVEPMEEAPGGKKKKKKKKKSVARKGGPEPEVAAAPTPTGAQAQPEVMAGNSAPGGAPQSAVQPQPAAAAAGADAGGGEGPRTAAEFEALGFNAYINKDYPKALEFYEKVLQIDPNFPNVQNIINECLMRLGKK